MEFVAFRREVFGIADEDATADDPDALADSAPSPSSSSCCCSSSLLPPPPPPRATDAASAAAAAAAASAVGGPITGALRRLAKHQTDALVRSLLMATTTTTSTTATAAAAAAAAAESAASPAPDETLDVLFRHRLLLLQARKGYRCNVDSLVLAAHVAAQLPYGGVGACKLHLVRPIMA